MAALPEESGADDPNNSDPPISVTTEVHPEGGRTGSQPLFAIPAESQSAVRPEHPNEQVCRDWARDLGGADVGVTYVRIVLQGRTRANVLIEGRILVKNRLPAIPGPYEDCTQVGGDFAVSRDVRVDLEDPNLRWEYYVLGQRQDGPFLLSITEGASEVIDLQVYARTALFEWTAELELLVDGERSVVPITDNGTVFRTSGIVSEG